MAKGFIDLTGVQDAMGRPDLLKKPDISSIKFSQPPLIRYGREPIAEFKSDSVPNRATVSFIVAEGGDFGIYEHKCSVELPAEVVTELVRSGAESISVYRREKKLRRMIVRRYANAKHDWRVKIWIPESEMSANARNNLARFILRRQPGTVFPFQYDDNGEDGESRISDVYDAAL